MNECRVLQADIDERAEIDDVQHGPLQLHADFDVIEREDSLAEDRQRQIRARVATGTEQRVHNVGQGGDANRQLFGQLRDRDRRQTLF